MVKHSVADLSLESSDLMDLAWPGALSSLPHCSHVAWSSLAASHHHDHRDHMSGRRTKRTKATACYFALWHFV